MQEDYKKEKAEYIRRQRIKKVIMIVVILSMLAVTIVGSLR